MVEWFWSRFGQPRQFPKCRKWFKIKRSPHIGRVAQLVRAPASHAGGHRFESCRAHHYNQSDTKQLDDLLPSAQEVNQSYANGICGLQSWPASDDDAPMSIRSPGDRTSMPWTNSSSGTDLLSQTRVRLHSPSGKLCCQPAVGHPGSVYCAAGESAAVRPKITRFRNARA